MFAFSGICKWPNERTKITTFRDTHTALLSGNYKIADLEKISPKCQYKEDNVVLQTEK